jgi:hypothetical protein
MRYRCPLWVISGHFAVQSACPLYPRKRTCGTTDLGAAADVRQTTRDGATFCNLISKSPIVTLEGAWQPKDQIRKVKNRVRSQKSFRRVTRLVATRRVRIDTDTERVYVAKVRPLSTILVVLIVGLLSALMLVLLLGALLVWLPLVVLFVTAALVAGLLRVYFQRGT